MNANDTGGTGLPARCLRCGSSGDSAFWQAGVCLRCASARLLSVWSDPPAAGAGAPALCADGLPVRIGPYEILEEIGRGGMGRVYAARQEGLGRIVALKVLTLGAAGPDFELRFLREAQTAARLRHPNVVAVHDFGRHDGQLCFSMDYVEDGDLSRRLRARPFTPAEAAGLLRKVALAVAYAHGEGVIHRDLKPSNVLLENDEPRIADFGLAAPLEGGGDLTQVTGVLGTPHYLAPEALARGSEALGVASDLYALGVILFELLTGRTPFAGAAPARLAALVDSSEAPSPRLLAPAVPADLETICLKCLEREPARRYPTAAALAEDLRRFLAGEPIVARPLSPPVRFVRWCRRRPALAAAWILALLLAVGGVTSSVVIERMLRRARHAEGESRERLREARLAEARAVRRTTAPGRRAQALAALAEAARIRPGADVRNEILNAQLVPDLRALASWPTFNAGMGPVVLAPNLQLALHAPVDGMGNYLGRTYWRRWGETNLLAALDEAGGQRVGEFRFSPNGSLVAARQVDDTLRVWRAGEAKPFLILRGRAAPGGDHQTSFYNDDFDFSTDSTLLVAGLPDGGCSLHELPEGREVGRQTGSVWNRLRFSPDGRWLAAASMETTNRLVVVHSLPNLAVAATVRPTIALSALAWSTNGVLAIGLTDNSIELIGLPGGRLLNRLTSPLRSPTEMAFVGEPPLLAIRGRSSSLAFINPVSGEEEMRLENFGIAPMASRPGAPEFAIATLDGQVTRWEMQPPTARRPVPPARPDGMEQSYNNVCLDFTRDGRLAVSSHGPYMLLRDLRSGRTLHVFDAKSADGLDPTTVAFIDHDQAILRCSAETGLSRIRFTDQADGSMKCSEPEVLSAETDWQMTDTSADRRRFALTAVDGSKVRIVELTDTGLREVARWDYPSAYSASFNPAADAVLVNGNGNPEARLRVFSVTKGKVLAELPAEAFGEGVWSANGRMAMTSNGQDRSVLWDTATWQPRATLTGDRAGNISTFQLSPDGRLAIVVRDGTVHVLAAADGSELAAFQVPTSPGMASAIRFLPDGRRFGILWRDSQLDLFDLEAFRSTLEPLGLAGDLFGRP